MCSATSIRGQNQHLRIRILVFANGERLPVLVYRDTGTPHTDSTLFVTQTVRPRSAHNTIRQVLQSLLILFSFLDEQSIDLRSRCREGIVLSLGEIEELARRARLRCVDVVGPAPKINSSRRAEQLVSGDTQSIRLTYIARFIRWLVNAELYSIQSIETRQFLQSTRDETLTALLERRARKSPEALNPREGLDPKCRQRLLEVTNPEHPDNPWRQRHTRHRNQVLVRWLYDLGIRRAEVAGVALTDMPASMTSVRIIRRPDDPDDPRKDQPNVKTLSHDLDLTAELSGLTRDYVLHERRHIRGARFHKFLFVASVTGAPMSLSAINRVFTQLRAKVPNLPGNMTPHVMRYTWNDRYSETVDAMIPRPSRTEEEETRNYQMGWVPGSNSAARYSRRHIRERSNEILMQMQKTVEGE